MASANAVGMGMAGLNFGLFIKPMGDDLGLSRAAFGWAQTAQQGTSAVASPFVGRLIDRYGSRLLLPLAALVTAGVMCELAAIDTAWQMIALFAVMGLIGLNGPGALISAVPITKWFVRNRSKALAFMGLGLPVGALAFIPLTQYLIEERGWRQTWVILAVLGAAVMVPLAWLFARRQPEDMGMKPDGLAGASELQARDTVTDEVSWTVRQAVRTRQFWSLVTALALGAAATGTIGLHRMAEFEDRGLDAGTISVATALDAVCAGTTAFAMGFLARVISPRVLGAVGFAALGVATVITIYVQSVPTLFASMMLFSAGIGGWIFFQNIIWAEYFGRARLGSIRGIVTPITIGVGGIGAPVAGYARDATGSFNVVWWAAAGMLGAAALIVVLTAAPRPAKSRA